MQTRTVPSTFRALRTHDDLEGTVSRLESLKLSDLSSGEVVIRSLYSGVNYKDSLAIHGRAKIISSYPRIAGIEVVGEVVESSSQSFTPGDSVIVHGFQTGIAFDGGFSEYVRAPAAHVMALPEGLSSKEAAIIGVAGFSAAMALDRFEQLGLTPESGLIGLSGASGAVGFFATALFSHLGYQVAAITRKVDEAKHLLNIGAHEIIDAAEIQNQNRALEKGRFTAVIDNVGGPTLSWLLRSLQDNGLAAAIGNASGNALETNILPFIVRNVQMFGIMANAPWSVRRRVWSKLANEWKIDFSAFEAYTHTIALQDLMAHSQQQLAGKTSGRTLIAY